jgi:glc operon protein GlcG
MKLSSLILSLLFSSAIVFAQQPAAPPVQGIDLVTAQRIVNAAVEAAKAKDAKVSVAVVDINGDLVAFARMDGTQQAAVPFAEGKARAALLFGMPTKDVQEAMAAGKPLTATINKPISGAKEITILRGGLPIVKNGKIVGAAASAGSSSANDESFVQAALDALGK